jgi:NADH dehydrogenase
MKKYKIAIIGGGFSGVQAARVLARRFADAEILLIDQTGNATMIPALPDLLSGHVPRASIARPLTEFVGPRVRVVTTDVQRVLTRERRLLGTDLDYEYDGLVLAAGSAPAPLPSSMEGAPVFTVHSFAAASALRAALEEESVPRPARLLVVGAGYTGLELAVAASDGLSGENAEITVVDPAPAILPMLLDHERERVHGGLAQRGIRLRTGVTVERLEALGENRCRATLSDGSVLEDVVVCWSAGMRASPIEFDKPVELSPDGRIQTNEHLQLPEHPEVFVAGDLAALQRDGVMVRRAVNFAYYSGRRAGQNLAAFLTRGQMRPFNPVDLGWIIPLGDESAGRLFGRIPIRGRFALRVHYLMCWYRSFGGAAANGLLASAFAPRRAADPLASTTQTRVSR